MGQKVLDAYAKSQEDSAVSSDVETVVRPIDFEDYVVDCRNLNNCGWKGLASECKVTIQEDSELYCPECGSLTEPANEI